MFTTITNFIRARGKYCCCCFGNNDEYLLILKHLRPYIEAQLQGVKVYIACRDESHYLLHDEPRVVLKSRFDRHEFGHVRELKPDKEKHPLTMLLEESGIDIPVIRSAETEPTTKVYFSSASLYPCKPLAEAATSNLIKSLHSNGKTVLQNEAYDGVSSVFATEGLLLLQGCLAGASCTLIDNGNGGSLLRRMFPGLKSIRI